MYKRLFHSLIYLNLFTILMILRPNSYLLADSFVSQDTTKSDTVKLPKNMYNNVDVYIIYPWNEDEPERHENVRCQIIKENKQVKEIKLFLKTRTDCIKIKKGLIRFEIHDHKTKKLIIKGP